MSHITTFQKNSFTDAVRKIAFEYGVNNDTVEQLLCNAMKNYGMSVDKTPFGTLIQIFERDCSDYLQNDDLGLVA